ncbi:MAG: gliding motility-associated ABC transporter permease subunit GldF [Bacteroidetes bacterium]|nr:gliding motility-associated ABC transporter permease subunit GldF [Bacteroidota bacterium]
MWALYRKEISQFFSSLSGIIAIVIFLIVNGLVLFVFEDNILDFGYATLDRFFELSPWILLLLAPAITMWSFAEEFRTGTWEVLLAQPLTFWQLLMGKYLSAFTVVAIALMPTFFYAFLLQELSAGPGLDWGATMGSYLGLYILAAVFTAIGIWCSSLSANTIVAFLLALIFMAVLYYGFHAISLIPGIPAGLDYLIEWMGIDFHYRSISRGLLVLGDLVYFGSLLLLLFLFTLHNLRVR